MASKVSHGRGGAANITPDDTPYADGEIVREGAAGDQGDGTYSSGRGGTGNIGGTAVAEGGAPHDGDVVPETAMRIAKEESHHIGRGGAGNEKHVHEKTAPEKTVKQYGFDKKVPHENLIDKAKNFIKGKKEN